MLNTLEQLTFLDTLKAQLSGQVVGPDDAGFDEARCAWNLSVDQRPAAVVLAESPADVVAAVEVAREHGLRVAPQGTGHNAHPLENALAGSILVKTSRMRRVEIDPERRVARAEAGAVWTDVTVPAAEYGLAALAGSSPDVGVVGYMLGGGVSWLARRYGLAANRVVAIELVTADGRVARSDPDNEPDLFWALRGGGGSFGVVTAIEFELLPIERVYAGALFFPQERAREVLHAWRAWTQAGLPDEICSVGRLMNMPPLPEVPEPLRGRSFVVLEATYLGDEADGERLIAPLRALGPEIDTLATIPAVALSELHMDPPHPVPGKGDGMMLDDVTPETIDALVEAASPGLLSVELRHLGGALRRSAPGHGALDSLEGDYVMYAVGMTPVAEAFAAVEAAVAGVGAALAPWAADQMYLNFAERPIDARRLYSREYTYRRLRAVKGRYDPHDVFQSNHPIRP